VETERRLKKDKLNTIFIPTVPGFCVFVRAIFHPGSGGDFVFNE
jgi:hypothetical protein